MNMRPNPDAHPISGVSAQVEPKLRQRVEQAIEALLLLLDVIDGDPDLEPSLGAPEAALPNSLRYVGTILVGTSQERWAAGADDEEEEEEHDAEDDPAELGFADRWGSAV